MVVEIDDRSGFCFGVVNAITLAEKSLAKGEPIYSLGDIVHNRVEVQRLEKLGLGTIRHGELEKLRGSTILIRAHGEPPATYRKAEALDISIVDATCPVVALLQKRVAQAYENMSACNGQVVILGRIGHAEVDGLTGQVEGEITVIEGRGDLDKLDFDRPIYLLSQTTQSLALFEEIKREIYARAADGTAVTIEDTICRRVANREPHLAQFAARFDVVLFVSGRKSSNGAVLFEICRGANPRCYMIEEEAELEGWMLDGAQSVGICGATSTPRWIMERIAEKIKETDK